MKKTGMVLLTAALFFFSTLIPSLAADASKIGIVDFQKILADSSTGQKAKAEINKKGKELEASLKEKGMEIEELKNKIQRESLVMSKEKREEKQRELRIKINDFKTLKKSYTEKFQEMEGRLVNKSKKGVVDIA
ncbi:MAG: OmpH family outer membrane protein, partial [Desulfobacteraceae bacterium]